MILKPSLRAFLKPTFVAPVVAMVNQDAVVDNTNKVDSIPQTEWRKEESLRLEKDHLARKLKEKEITEKEYAKQIITVTNSIKAYDQNLKQQLENQIAIEKLKASQEAMMRDELFKSEKTIFNFRRKQKDIA